MKRTTDRLSRRYATALRNSLKQDPQANLQTARRLGRQAVALGLETLDLAKIHQKVFATLEASRSRDGLTKRAGMFFAEAITPIIETHRAARENKVQLDRLQEMLARRTMELAATNRQLQRSVLRREKVEGALKRSGIHYTKLLRESLQLQEGLRQLTHQVLAAQENERKKISRELQDEIAQTLLGINVRLLSLKQEAKTNTKGLKNEIVSTQRLVVKSAKSVRRIARDFQST
jgi:two-component system sensor histidine kinase DegS